MVAIGDSPAHLFTKGNMCIHNKLIVDDLDLVTMKVQLTADV